LAQKSKTATAILAAILAAALYGISSPISKLLLSGLPPTLMAALLYLGAGSGMLMVNIYRLVRRKNRHEARVTRQDFPFIIGMIVLDIAAPIFLMIGLTMATAESAALLNNFEIVATSLIALLIFREAIGKRMWLAIGLITLASSVLSLENAGSFRITPGSVFVLLASICWGFENNCTRMLSLKDPLQIVVIKGFGSGIGSLAIAFALREQSGNILYIGYALILGFFAYGLSIYFYISAQRELGAARTSAFYAAAPFIGVLLSWIVLQEGITATFLAALFIMLAGTYFAISEYHSHRHRHEAMTHDHKHNHQDGHHTHVHQETVQGEHSHQHTHAALEHQHAHTPDLHHRHRH